MNEQYLQNIYNYIVAVDDSFEGKMTFDAFKEKMGSQQYAAKIYDFMGETDDTFKSKLGVVDFLDKVGTVKKKEPAQDTDSKSEDTSSESFTVDNTEYLFSIDPNNIQGRDTRQAGYVDPITLAQQQINKVIGTINAAEPGERQLQAAMTQREMNKPYYLNAVKQSEADKAFTEQQIANAQAGLDVMVANEEEQVIAANIDMANANRDIVNSETFKNDLANITEDKIALDEDEGADYFAKMLGKYGITVRKKGGGIKKFFGYIGGMEQEDIDKEFNGIEVSVVTPNGVKTEYIDVDTFTTAGGKKEAEKLRKFVRKYAQTPSEQRENVTQDVFSQNSIRAQELRKTPRINDDGTESTVLFESAVIDGRPVVYPTLFPKNQNVESNDPYFWMEKRGMDAYETALERGEVFSGFKDEEEANRFAEGAWKDVNNVDVEADRFYRERGQDYFSIKEQFNEYERARDRIDWIEDAQSGNEMRNRELRFLTPEEKELYGDLYGTDGFIRADIQDVLLEERQTEKDLLPIYTNDYLQEIREDFDIYMDKKYNKIARQATLENASAKVVQNDLQVKSLTEFGVNLDELQDFQPTNERGAILKDAILTSLKATKDVQQAAADTYQVAETYLDVKFDKNLRGELVDNWAGMSNEIRSGWFRGKAGDVILKLALGLEDVDDDYTTQQLAEEVVRYMEKSNTGKTSRAMSRWHSARGFREAFDAFIDNPAELALSLAGNSLSQMLPYGWKILGTATATGTATGAGIGMTGFVTGPGGVVTTAAGALTGFSWGLRSGFAATGYALEYTNAVLDGAKEYNYNILNPDEMKAAFQDERVWKFGRKRGAQRGIPIAIVDFLSAGLAGRIFQTGKTAALGTKIGLQVGERALFDPLAEGLGEYLAQKSAGQKIDWKEIFAEGLGGLGNNAPFMALNMALDMRASNNVDIANDLSTLKGLNRELKNYMISPTRVSNWANNMQRLGQITSEQNQRIQENLGIRKDALNILENPKALGLQSRTNRSVLSRTMELLAAKKDLESTTNRKEVFRNKIKDINIELAEIAETKTLRPKDQQTNLNIGGISGPQQTETDVRSDVTASYKIGDQTFNRPDFIKRIQNMTLEVFNDSNVQVENDKEVQDIINNKFKKDAIQEPKAENVDENQQAGVVSDLVTTVRKQADESQTFTEIAEVIDKPNKSDQTKFNNNKLEGERLDGILLGISERQDNKKPLTVLQKKIADKFKERLNEVVSLKTQLIEEKSKTIDNEAKDLENVLIEEGVVEKKETKVTEEQGIDRRQGVIEERDQFIEDTQTEIKNVRSQLKKDLKKKNLSKEQKADLREEAKNLIDGYEFDIKEARREASKQLSLIQLEEGRKKKAEAKKVLKKTKAINDIDAEIEAIRKDKKRNRATKSVLIQELQNKKKRIEESGVDFRSKDKGDGRGIDDLSLIEFINNTVEMEDVGQFLQFLNKSFPFVTISVDQETFNKIISNPEVSTYVKNGQVIYGMTKDGQIFINSQVHNSKSDLFNTAIHEMGHVWIKNLLLSEKGKAIYKKGASLIKKTALYSKNLKRFDGDVNKAVEETMATLIGNKGESVVNTTLKQQIKNWISSLWEFVKSQFKLSKDLTVEEIQDLTLDQFLETAIADILSGKPVKIEDGKLSTLTKSMADVMFRVDDTITKIVESGRRNGFSDASIKKVLQGRGFLVSQINEAMEFDVDTTQPLPSEFLRIEGTENQSGIERAAKLFNDVNLQLQKFSMKLGQRVKTFSEIRQKAQELLKAHPIFEAQPEQVQKELQVAFDRTLGYRSNKNIQREISEIKKSLNERKIGVDNLQRLKITMKNFIRQNLPPSKKYTQAKINRLISAITNIKRPEDAVAAFEKVTKVIAEQRGVIKKDVLNKIYKIVSDKSSFRLQSKKRRPKGVDAVTQVVFNNIKEVLDAVRITNPEKRAEALKKISDYLLSNQQTIDEAAQKSLNNEELTLKEESLLQLQLAYDQYADLAEASLEQAQAVLTDVENLKAEGILKFNTRRLQKAEAAAKRTEEVTNQIKDTNPDLFRKDEDGNITDETKTREEIEQEIEDVRQGFLKAGIMKVYNTVVKGIFGRGDLFQESYKNFITHMGTVTNFLDNKAKGLNVFTDKVYKKLNRASEVVLQNKRNMQRKLNDFAVQSGFKSLLDFEGQLNRKLGIKKDGRPNVKELTVNVIDKKTNQPTGRTKKVTLNANNLLRVYALSKNEIQKSKLENMGITADVLAEIENELGPELISFADKIVDYFSTDYFNEINAVYKQANGINLGFIENYFPTKTERSKVDGKLLENGDFNGIFSSETAPAFKERTDNFSPILLKGAGFIDTMQNHVDTMETYKALAIPVQELNQFFQIPAVDLLLDVTGMKKLLKTLVNATVNPQSASSAAGVNVSGNFMQRIANKFTGFALAFKAIQILKQATSFVNAFSQYNYFAPDSKIPKAIRGPFELAMFMVDGAGVLMGIIPDLFGGNGVIAKARKMSATFDQRIAEGLEGDVYGLEAGSVTQKQVGQGVAGRMAKFRKGFKRLAASPTILGDILGVMGYYINYKRNIANGMSEAQALEEFNDYNATQQSRRNTEKIPLQLQGDFASRAFTMFGSTLFLQINKVMQSTNNLKKSFLAGFEKDGNTLKKTARGTKQLLEDKQNIRDFYLNFAVANVLFTAVSNIALLTRGDDEDKDAFVRKIKDAMMGLNLLYQIPLIGAAAETGINTFRGEGYKPVDDVVNPFTSIYKKIARQFREAQEQDSEAKKVLAVLTPLVELYMGAQVDPFVGLINAVKDGVFGDVNQEEFYENIYDFLGITPSYRPGFGRRGSKVEGIIPQGGIRTKTDLKRYDPKLYEELYGERDKLQKEIREERKKMLEEMGFKEIGGKLYPIN